MDYEKLDEVASKLESKYIPESAKGNLEAKEILAITQAYRIMRIEITKRITCDNCGSTDTFNTKNDRFCNQCKSFY